MDTPFIRKVLNAAIDGESVIESRMASSSKYAVDPVTLVPGLNKAVEKIKDKVKNNEIEEAKKIMQKYLQEGGNV